MALEKEIETYHREHDRLIPDSGKYVLIHGDKVIDVFGTYEDALKAGYKEVGLNPFLVKKIVEVEQVQYITRHVREPGAFQNRDAVINRCELTWRNIRSLECRNL
jgi:hypothetical protein